MQSHTRAAIEAILKSDSTVTSIERNRLLATEEKPTVPLDRVISRTEAAKRFGRCARSLDNWVHRGLLKSGICPACRGPPGSGSRRLQRFYRLVAAPHNLFHHDVGSSQLDRKFFEIPLLGGVQSALLTAG